MSGPSFILQPFAPADAPPPFRLTGVIARSAGQLSIHYDLLGPLGQLAIPAQTNKPARRHGLWQNTCFEFFLAVKDAQAYWEFSLSLAGHWNVYRFDAYRQGMQEEEGLSALPFSVCRQPGSLHLALEFEPAPLIQAGRTLEVGIAAVLKHQDGRLTYWASAHPGPRADFHRRDSFIIQW
jgi:hypothetical protein